MACHVGAAGRNVSPRLGFKGMVMTLQLPLTFFSPSFSILTFWAKNSYLKWEGRVGGKSSSPGLGSTCSWSPTWQGLFSRGQYPQELTGQVTVWQNARDHVGLHSGGGNRGLAETHSSTEGLEGILTSFSTSSQPTKWKIIYFPSLHCSFSQTYWWFYIFWV